MSKPAPPANADASALPMGEPRVDIRLSSGDIIHDVDQEQGRRIVAASLGVWRGTANRRYIRLSENITALPGQLRSGMKTTQRAKNDRGEWIGPGPSTQEHKGAA